MNNQDAGTFFALLRDALSQSSAPPEKLSRFMDLLTEDNYSSVSSEDAAEISSYLEEASSNMEKEILDSGDIGKINNLTELKKFTNDLLNEAEKSALDFVINNSNSSSNDMQASAPKQSNGLWLLDKFAGLIDKDEE